MKNKEKKAKYFGIYSIILFIIGAIFGGIGQTSTDLQLIFIGSVFVSEGFAAVAMALLITEVK